MYYTERITADTRPGTLEIRAYRPSDCEETARLFYDTVHTVNAADYTAEQLDAWAGPDMDYDGWQCSFNGKTALVAVRDGRIVGFGDITSGGYLDRLYVHKDCQHQGIASALCDALEAACLEAGHVTVQASVTAKPFFLGRGYRVEKEQEVIRRGMVLKNYRMEKVRGSDAGA